MALFGAAVLFNVTALAPTVYFLVAQRELGRPWRRSVPKVLSLSVLGAGIMVNSVVAILAAFRRRPSPFERTPKFGIAGQGDTWQGKAYRAAVSRVTGGGRATILAGVLGGDERGMKGFF